MEIRDEGKSTESGNIYREEAYRECFYNYPI